MPSLSGGNSSEQVIHKFVQAQEVRPRSDDNDRASIDMHLNAWGVQYFLGIATIRESNCS
jgi:hypothetical protein